jgi:hypothetical protein
LPLPNLLVYAEKAARNGAQHNIPLSQRKSFFGRTRCANAFFYRPARIDGARSSERDENELLQGTRISSI